MHNKETLAIIDVLAEGVKPVIGETLPEISPYDDPLVVRAFFETAQLLRQQLSQAEPPRHLPARAGNPWAEMLKRRVNAVEARLAKLGIRQSHDQ
jgi:hypothetical protein